MKLPWSRKSYPFQKGQQNVAYQLNGHAVSPTQLQQYLGERMKTKEVEKIQSDQPIVGLRVWKVIMEGGLPKLRSVYKETVWPYRKALERDCLNDMGIHAVKSGIRGPSIVDPAGIMSGMDVLSLFATYEADVAGEVYLWGKVDEHEIGYLADFAYPKRLFPHAGMDPVTAMQLEDEYGVPVEFRPEFEKAKPQACNVSAGSAVVTAYSLAASSAAQQFYQQQLQAAQQLQNVAGMYTQGLLGGVQNYNPFNPFKP